MGFQFQSVASVSPFLIDELDRFDAEAAQHLSGFNRYARGLFDNFMRIARDAP